MHARKIPLWVLSNPSLAQGHSKALALAAQPHAHNWSVILEGGPGNLSAPTGVTLHQLAAQCVCCVGQLPLRVILARIIRQEKPARIVLELLHAEHLERALELLQSGSFGEHLQLESAPV